MDVVQFAKRGVKTRTDALTSFLVPDVSLAQVRPSLLLLFLSHRINIRFQVRVSVHQISNVVCAVKDC